MDEYFHNHVMGKASLSRNHEEKDKKNETATHHFKSILFYFSYWKLSYTCLKDSILGKNLHGIKLISTKG